MIIKLQWQVLKLEHQVIVSTINNLLTSRHLVQIFTSVTHQLITLKVAGINVQLSIVLSAHLPVSIVIYCRLLFQCFHWWNRINSALPGKRHVPREDQRRVVSQKRRYAASDKMTSVCGFTRTLQVIWAWFYQEMSKLPGYYRPPTLPTTLAISSTHPLINQSLLLTTMFDFKANLSQKEKK